MTKYDLWTMKGERLLAGYKNACAAEVQGDERAPKAVEILGGEILRRLRMLEEECEEE